MKAASILGALTVTAGLLAIATPSLATADTGRICLSSLNTGKFLVVENNKAGSDVALSSCYMSPSFWVHKSDGTLRNEYNGKCLDTNGSAVYTSVCWAGDAGQRWSIGDAKKRIWSDLNIKKSLIGWSDDVSYETCPTSAVTKCQWRVVPR
ncbi:ricin-type beta-trefoil lectin domain protein [Nonomuraea polychroma]|uniref:ricin-type beta-trefoil lectin domain protein n=1 Tax=Nonomuraea polychroma TaxID=46176 RepID=UPI003D910497